MDDPLSNIMVRRLSMHSAPRRSKLLLHIRLSLAALLPNYKFFRVNRGINWKGKDPRRLPGYRPKNCEFCESCIFGKFLNFKICSNRSNHGYIMLTTRPVGLNLEFHWCPWPRAVFRPKKTYLKPQFFAISLVLKRSYFYVMEHRLGQNTFINIEQS